MKYNWVINRVDSKFRVDLESKLGLAPLIAHLLVKRGIKQPDEAFRFLNPRIEYLYPPELMKGITKAVGLIKKFCERKACIVIYGDYDVDGISAAALLYETLKFINDNVFVFIPNRLSDGYGLSITALERCLSYYKLDLLITVDCGIRALEEVKFLKAKGVEVIITDHHLPGQELPAADVIVNPKVSDCSYPYKDLSGVGVVFKLCEALLGNSREFLDLVALGTVADVVPLLGENRIIVKNGIRFLEDSMRPGLEALMKLSGLSRISVRGIGYVLGPRLNSAGRLKSAMRALNLLICKDPCEANIIARELCECNISRQKLQERVFKEALVEANREVELGRKIIVLAKDSWHPGVIGIVASRLVDKFNRPVIIISLEDDFGRGSARSTGGFDITAALSMCRGYLLGFGGHKFAAGFSITRAKIKDFRDFINKLVDGVIIDEFKPSLIIDGRLKLSMLSFSLIEQIQQLAPFGEGNPKPIFLFQNLKLRSPIKVMSRDTIKFWVTDGVVSIPVIGFGLKEAKAYLESRAMFDLVASPTINSFRGFQEAQLELVDWN